MSEIKALEKLRESSHIDDDKWTLANGEVVFMFNNEPKDPDAINWGEQWRKIADEIEAEIAERFVALPVDAISESDAPKSEETVENDTSKDDIRNFDDSREKLEADVREILHSAYMLAWMHGNENRRGCSFGKLHREFYNLLDRQAEITRGECAECAESMGAYADRLCDPLKERIDELTAERAEIAELVGWDESCDEGGFHTLVPMVAAMCEGNEKAAKFAVELEKQREIAAARGKQIEALEHLLAERKVRYLYAKVCEQRKGLEALEGGDLGQAVRERDMWRDRCGKLLDAAHELARLADAYE